MHGPSEERPADGGPIGPEVLGRLFDEHGPALAFYAAQWTDAADDCVQEALVELAAQPQAPSNVRAWLFRVVKHRALNMARGEQRRRRREDRAAEQRLVHSSEKGGDRLDALVVAEALERLSASEREIVAMRIWGGLTFHEIAAALDGTTTNVHRQYHQALGKLRQLLESPCETSTKLKRTS